MTLRLKMEDPSRYLPPTHVVEWRWYVINDAVIDGLTKQPCLEMVGTKAECEAFMAKAAQ